jgi:hypothetical protein
MIVCTISPTFWRNIRGQISFPTPTIVVANHDSGGTDVLLDLGGQDATEAFEEVDHSAEAREMLSGLQVGVLHRYVRCKRPIATLVRFATY